MSVRVNLLPQVTRERDREARQRVMAMALFLVVVAGLGGASLWQRAQLATAEEELAMAEAELSRAQQEVAELAEFASLADSLEQAGAAVVAALGDQATLAGVLQDLALTIPEDSALSTLNVQFAPRGDEPTQDIGTVTASLETVSNVAPGVERLLLSLERAVGFADVHLSGATVDDEDVTMLNLDVSLGAEHYTERFRDGIPEVHR